MVSDRVGVVLYRRPIPMRQKLVELCRCCAEKLTSHEQIVLIVFFFTFPLLLVRAVFCGRSTLNANGTQTLPKYSLLNVGFEEQQESVNGADQSPNSDERRQQTLVIGDTSMSKQCF